MQSALAEAVQLIMNVPLLPEPKTPTLQRKHMLYCGRPPIVLPIEGESRQVRRARERTLAKRTRQLQGVAA